MSTTLSPLTPAPVPPGPTDGVNFAARANEFLGWMYAFGPEVNEWIAAFNNATTTVNSSITTAVTAASTASTAAANAANALAQSLAAINASGVYPPSLVTSFYDPTAGLPGSPVSGRAYVASATANGWVVNRIYKYSGTAWVEYAPTNGWMVLDVATPAYWRWDGSTWARQLTAADVSIGVDANQVPTWAMLGTAAGLDQTWLNPPAATWDAGSVASGAQTSTTISAPGADIGDYVVDATCEISLQGLHLRGVVAARNTVTLYLANLTGATVDLPSAVYHVRILKLIPRRG